MVQRSLVEEATRPVVLLVFSALIGLLFYLYYRYIYSPYQAFAGTGVKGPKPTFLLGSALEYLILGEKKMYHKFWQSYGPVFGFYMGTRPVVVVAEPSLLDTVLKADCHTFTTAQQQQFLMSTLSVHGLPSVKCQVDDEDNQKARKCLRSILSLPKLLKLIVPVVLQNYDTVLHEILEKCTDSPSIDMWSVYHPYCLQVILGALGLSSGKLSEPISTAVTSYYTAVNTTGSTELIVTSLFGSVPCLEEMIKSVRTQAKAEEEFITLVGVVSEAVREARLHHQHTGVKRNYLQVLLDHTLTDDQVVSYMLLTLLVGYHTVLTTLCCTTHQLAAHPPHQQTLYNEISNSVRRETLYYETVDSLEFLDAVVQESLRLHCLTPKLSRVCVKDTNIKGATIQKHMRVEIPVNFIHHLSSYWDKPHSFCPDRFIAHQPLLNHAIKCPTSHNMTFLPFGHGSHSCLGMRFAVTCIKLTLTEILQRYKFSKPQQVMADFQLAACPVRRPAGGLHVRVTRRHKFKRQLSFASVVKSAMDRQSVEDVNS